jgi:hypothetical protein
VSNKRSPNTEAADKKEATRAYPVQSIIPVKSFADFQVSKEDVISALQQDATTLHEVFLAKVGTENE